MSASGVGAMARIGRATNCDGRTWQRSMGSVESFKRTENSRILKSIFR